MNDRIARLCLALLLITWVAKGQTSTVPPMYSGQRISAFQIAVPTSPLPRFTMTIGNAPAFIAIDEATMEFKVDGSVGCKIPPVLTPAATIPELNTQEFTTASGQLEFVLLKGITKPSWVQVFVNGLLERGTNWGVGTGAVIVFSVTPPEGSIITVKWI